MKHRLATATLALLMLTASSAGIVSAAGPSTHATHAATFAVGCTPAVAGGAIQVRAKVLHATRARTFTASATAAFATTSPTANLRRAGKSFVAVGKIAVPADQPAGPVVVTMTITYNGTPTTLTCTSRISLADTTP